MDVNKITILPMSRYLPKVVLNEPSLELVSQRLVQAATANSENLPARILKKVAKAHNIPDYVNLNSFVIKRKSSGEDARVLGGCNLDFYS